MSNYFLRLSVVDLTRMVCIFDVFWGAMSFVKIGNKRTLKWFSFSVFIFFCNKTREGSVRHLETGDKNGIYTVLIPVYCVTPITKC